MFFVLVLDRRDRLSLGEVVLAPPAAAAGAVDAQGAGAELDVYLVFHLVLLAVSAGGPIDWVIR